MLLYYIALNSGGMSAFYSVLKGAAGHVAADEIGANIGLIFFALSSCIAKGIH